MPKQLFIGVYRYDRFNMAAFSSFVGEKQDFKPEALYFFTDWICDLVKVRHVPSRWLGDMQKLIDAPFREHYRNNPGLTPIGSIAITVAEEKGNTIARTFDYYPKKFFYSDYTFPNHDMKLAVPGFGYAMEWTALSDLKGPVTHVSTSMDPEPLRIQQLERVGLPIHQPLPIDEWLKGLLRGYAKSCRNHRT
jgi:hypothetical protein